MPWSTRAFHMTCQEAYSPLLMQRVMKRFWSPFSRGLVGPELRTYGFKEVFDNIRTHDSDFTCQVNGHVGDAKVIENFFIVLLCGFDVVEVKLENSSMSDVSSFTGSFKGTFTLAHTRPFLGWNPQSITTKISSSASEEENRIEPKSALVSPPTSMNETEKLTCPPPINTNTNTNTTNTSILVASTRTPTNTPVLLRVPFSGRLEGCQERISHMTLRSPVRDVLGGHGGCPAGVRRCLQTPEALEMLASLRRAHVRPELITDKTLLSVSTRKEAWASALGIL